MRIDKKSKIMFLFIGIAILSLIAIRIYEDNSIKKNNSIQEKKELVVNLIDNLTVEQNSNVTLLSFLDNYKNGELISKDYQIDTSKEGFQKLQLDFKVYDMIKTYEFEIEIIGKK